MYVCICQAVTEKDILDETQNGSTTVGEVCKKLGCATQCGKCASHVREVHASAKMDLQASA
jgi:bacterioferritin-associated ferredoxin